MSFRVPFNNIVVLSKHFNKILLAYELEKYYVLEKYFQRDVLVTEAKLEAILL